MSITRAKFQRLLYPGLNELILNSFDEVPDRFSEWANVKSSSAAFEEDLSAAGVGLFVRTPENVEAAEDEFSPGFPKRYNHEDYTLGIAFSHQAMRDGKIAIWNERAGDLGYSAKQTMEILIHDILNSGFTTANGPDGKALFAADHPNIRQGTQSNLLDPIGPITVTNYRQALVQFRRFFDHTGVRRRVQTPAVVIVPPEREYDIKEIVQSTDRPDTANRATNVSSNLTRIIVSEYLTDTNNWFMSVDKSRHKVKVYKRENFHTWEDEDLKARLNWVYAAMAFSYGFSDWMGWLGSNPA